MPTVASAPPTVPAATEPEPVIPRVTRFTLDGDGELESHLARVCASVRAGVKRLVPRRRLEGILLGGGYGRGEGGVLRTPEGDRPYNDLEFYVFLRGSTVLNDRRYRARLTALAHELSAAAGIEVEFKVLSLAKLRRSPVSMFSYDLVRGHSWVCGHEALLRTCAHHERAESIPLAEATRLLMNRCSGLLFARQRLDGAELTRDDADFVERNLAKARLALGDAVLVAFGRYHWSCRERGRRLAALHPPEWMPWFEAVQAEHGRGVDFKLHPHRSTRAALELRDDLRQLSLLACRVWLWLESLRLGETFRSAVDYTLHPADKCPETSPRWNWLVNLRHFGGRALFASGARRYPRERLLCALPVLLWQPAMLDNRRVLSRLQRDLQTPATDERSLLAAYTGLWEIFR